MKKKRLRYKSTLSAYLKVFKIMKLTVLLLLLGICQAMANIKAQDKVTLSMNKAVISKILNSIEKQGHYPLFITAG